MKYKEYQKYETVGEWWEKAGRGKFPIQVPAAIARLQKERDLTFQQAFEELVEKGAIVLVNE